MSLSSYHFCKMQYLCTYLLVSIGGSRDVGILYFWVSSGLPKKIRRMIHFSTIRCRCRRITFAKCNIYIPTCLFPSKEPGDVGILNFEVSSGLPKRSRRIIYISAIRCRCCRITFAKCNIYVPTCLFPLKEPGTLEFCI